MKKCVLDCSAIANPEDFHDALVETLVLPQWYGSNLDALYDCLGDIRERTHLVLKNWEHTLSFSNGFRLVLDEAENNNPHLFVTFQ